VLADFIELALNTGCRKSELLSLKWEHVDLSTRLLRLEETKSGEWQTVPINEQARQVLIRRLRHRKGICPTTPFVFFHKRQMHGASVGDQVKDVKTSFASACVRSGIKDFHIHDLRHTFASWLVANGTPLLEVSKLLRHASITMTEKYTHLAPDHLHKTVENLGFTAQSQHSAKSTKAAVLKIA
jgi:integrase